MQLNTNTNANRVMETETILKNEASLKSQMSKGNLKLLVLVACLFMTFAGQAETIRYVKLNGTGDGSSWENAAGNIQTMVDASASGDQVWIASGTYLLAATLQMKDGVDVYGGFQGSESNINDRPKSDLDANGTIEAWEFTNSTILDGQNARRVLNQAGAFETETVWDGVTITKGSDKINETGSGAYIRANGKLNGCIVTQNVITSSYSIYGGGIWNSGTISNCMVNGNKASMTSISNCYGGGIYNAKGGTVTNCTVIGNTASSSAYSSSGGGIYNNGTVSDCTVNENTASAYAQYSWSPFSLGGGIYNNGGTINNCTVNKNSANSISNSGDYTQVSCSYGGGIYNKEGMVSDCIINGNTATALANYSVIVKYAIGSGIYNYGGETVSNCMVSGNATSTTSNFSRGGGISRGNISHCVIKDNTSGEGGGLWNSTAKNCLLLNNKASDGGGACEGWSGNCTFVSNTATKQGGGISGGTANSCIFWSSTSTGSPIYNGTVLYSAIQGGYDGEGNISITQDNESVKFVDPTTDNYQLQTGSPCINTGRNGAISAQMDTDLAGNPRIYDGTVDMGAYEWQGSAGIPNLNYGNSIIIYPNPVNDSFMVDYEGFIQVKIYDMLGKEILSQNTNGKTGINVNHLPKGIYNVRIASEGRIIGNSKIVKQ